MSDGVWFINDAGVAVDPASLVVNGRATARIRRVVVNYAYYGNSTQVQLWARANSPVSPRDLLVAGWERSTAPLPGDSPKPPEVPTPVPPTVGDVPVPSGTPPYRYAIPFYDSKLGQWRWAKLDVNEPPAGAGSGTYPSVSLYPSPSVFPGA